MKRCPDFPGWAGEPGELPRRIAGMLAEYDKFEQRLKLLDNEWEELQEVLATNKSLPFRLRDTIFDWYSEETARLQSRREELGRALREEGIYA